MHALRNKNPLVGVGLYTFAEAAVLTGTPVESVKRWLKGHGESPPLWDSPIVKQDLDGISFHDLLEIRFVHAFRKHGVPLQTIRRASQIARDLFDSPYPFTLKRFRTDGRRIFADAYDDTGEEMQLDLIKSQYTFAKIVEPSLYRGIEFDDCNLASRWFPTSSKEIFIDPKICFGKPIVSDGHVRTSILYQAVRAGDDKEDVASLYGVPLRALNAAIAFEKALLHEVSC